MEGGCWEVLQSLHLLQCMGAILFRFGVGGWVAPAHSNTGSMQYNGEVGEGKTGQCNLAILPYISRPSLYVPLVVRPRGVFHDQGSISLAYPLPPVYLGLEVKLAEI